MCHSETNELRQYPVSWSSYALFTPLPSMPDVVDLLETCVDDIMRTPVPMATAGSSEEAGPSASASAPSTGVENLSLAGKIHTHIQRI